MVLYNNHGDIQNHEKSNLTTEQNIPETVASFEQITPT